jgi:hypothetical protein
MCTPNLYATQGAPSSPFRSHAALFHKPHRHSTERTIPGYPTIEGVSSANFRSFQGYEYLRFLQIVMDGAVTHL